jgi:hypothetical protein
MLTYTNVLKTDPCGPQAVRTVTLNLAFSEKSLLFVIDSSIILFIFVANNYS